MTIKVNAKRSNSFQCKFFATSSMSPNSNPKFKLKLLVVSALAVLSFATPLPYSSSENEVEKRAEDEDAIDLSMFGERIYGHPDDKTGERISKFHESEGNPEEFGSYLEGDILIPSDSQDERNGILSKSYRWPGAIVPYEIRGRFTSRDMLVIQNAFNEYHAKTCVRFRPRTTETNYVSITSENTGCWSSVGRIGGRQQVNLQSPSCLNSWGTPIHELMHALGFMHEQNRWERDSYVRVLKENVKPGMLHNFAKSSYQTAYGFGVPYDYASLMHYSSKSFSRNGQPTLLALQNSPQARSMGQRNGFSAGDIAKINAMYRCKVRQQ